MPGEAPAGMALGMKLRTACGRAAAMHLDTLPAAFSRREARYMQASSMISPIPITAGRVAVISSMSQMRRRPSTKHRSLNDMLKVKLRPCSPMAGGQEASTRRAFLALWRLSLARNKARRIIMTPMTFTARRGRLLRRHFTSTGWQRRGVAANAKRRQRVLSTG